MPKKHKAYHDVSAFVAENQVKLGEVCVDEKSNEITDVSELLDLLDIEDTILPRTPRAAKKQSSRK